ncbi:MAG: hypothetical protein AAF587_13530 [Bacteroidota bacterium]
MQLHSILCFLLFLIGSPSFLFAQAISFPTTDKLVLHAAGFIYKLDCCHGLDFNHVQLGLGYRLTNKLGIGLGGGRWTMNDGYKNHRLSGLGMHVFSTSKRWVSRFEAGMVIQADFDHYSGVYSEHFSLQTPGRNPFLRLQGGVRFWNHGLNGIAGVGLYYIPVSDLTGVKKDYTGGQTVNTPKDVKKSFGGIQFFIGVWIQKDG